MGVLQDSMRAAMETRGYSESTVALYLTCVRVFAHHFGRSPLAISAEEIESFFHFLREQNKSDSTIHLYLPSVRLCDPGSSLFVTHLFRFHSATAW
jgi:hypothetical protein